MKIISYLLVSDSIIVNFDFFEIRRFTTTILELIRLDTLWDVVVPLKNVDNNHRICKSAETGLPSGKHQRASSRGNPFCKGGGPCT